MPTSFEDADYTMALSAATEQWRIYDETLVAVSNALVEPNRSLVIGPDRRLVRQSLSTNMPLYPSAAGYFNRPKETGLKEAVIYDGFSSQSYFHHLFDRVTGLVKAAERKWFRPSVPFVIARWAYESPFFAYLLERSDELRSTNWYVQEPNEWLHVHRAYCMRTNPYDPLSWSAIRRLYGQISSSEGRRVFLSRDSRRHTRGVRNEGQVASLLARYGFELVYAESLSLREQQEVFERCEYLVALQGMGLTQQFFMPEGSRHVLELMPRSRMTSDYYWQGWTIGMSFYDVLVGTALDNKHLYEVDIGELEQKVKSMLAHHPNGRRYGATVLPS
jgi:hypothetical protein